MGYVGAKFWVRCRSTGVNPACRRNILYSTANSGNINIWERLVEEEVRATHVPKRDVKNLEEEFRGTIGKSLGRQGHKILNAKQLMAKEIERYNTLLASLSSTDHTTLHKDIVSSARRYNSYRKQALQARWELIVQRQAAGFVVNNHNYMMEQYPIPPALPVPDESNDDTVSIMNVLNPK